MKSVLANSPLLGEAVGDERAVDGLDDLTTVAKVFQRNLGAVGDNPPATSTRQTKPVFAPTSLVIGGF
jgi:hypothetical protein